MTLRDKINAVIEENLRVLDSYGDWGTGTATTDILALVREALLSKAAVEAIDDAHGDLGLDVSYATGTWRDLITAAFDAVTGDKA